MSKLPGEKPGESRTWHNPDGTHRYPHPSTYFDRKSQWSAAERRYAAHLDRHEELKTNPEPMDGDPEVVVSLFRHIELLKTIIAKEKLLIHAVREKIAAGGEVDGKSITRMINSVDDRED